MIQFKKVVIGLSIALGFTSATAQTFSSKIVDKKTQEPIPYATVQYGENDGVITNEEGKFSFTIDSPITSLDSVYISSMGYEKLALAFSSLHENTIYIEPKSIELNEVFLFNKELSIEEIMERVVTQLDENYNRELTERKLFYRNSETNNLNRLNVKYKKSTIPEFNKKFIDSVTGIIPRKSEYYTETLGDFYGNYQDQKLNILKAAELYDKKNDGSMETLSENLEQIFNKNIKRNSYIKIKSGIFSQKIQVDSIIAATEGAEEIKEEVKKPKKREILDARKMAIKSLLSGMFFQENSKLNMIHKSNRYRFMLKDYTTINEELVYKISFWPKRKADFKGVLYVNADDFAVVRVDYTNVKSLKRIKLLGISYEETVYRGKTIFAKDANGKYSPRFIEKELGTKFGVDRPLKIIEKNKHVKGRKKQNELAVGIDVINSTLEKHEMVVFNAKNISSNQFKNATENKTISATYLSRYNPEFWKGNDIMEPNAAIRNFSVLEPQSSK